MCTKNKGQAPWDVKVNKICGFPSTFFDLYVSFPASQLVLKFLKGKKIPFDYLTSQHLVMSST